MKLLRHYLGGRGRRGWYGYNQFFLLLLIVVVWFAIVVFVTVVVVVTVVYMSYWFIITGGAHVWRLLGGRGRSSGVLGLLLMLIMAGVMVLVF